MSESAPRYIACASGANAFTDCLVMRHGDLIRLVGHAQMDFTPSDARHLVAQIQYLLDHPDRKVRPPEEELPPLAQAVIDRFERMFPEGTGWPRPLDIEYLADSARDLFLTIALAVETLREEHHRLISDGR